MNMQDTCRGTALVLLLAAGGAPLHAQNQAAAPSSGPAQAARQPAYYEDARFDARLQLESRVLTGKTLLDQVGGQLHVGLQTPDGWAKRPVGIAAGERRAWELMDALGPLFGGRWFFVEEGQWWVLARSQKEARAAARKEEFRLSGGPTAEFDRQADKRLFALIRSLTPQQWSRLEAGEKLAVRDLSPSQWAVLREAMVILMRDPTGPHMYTPRPAALQGQAQFWLRHLDLLRGGPAEAPGFSNQADGQFQVAFAWPGPDPIEDGLDHVAAYVERGSDGRWAPTTLRPGGAASGSTPPPATKPAPEAGLEDYRQDAGLNVKLSVDGPGVTWAGLLKAFERAKVPILMQGDWVKEPMRITVQRRPAARVMEDMATLARGEWKKVGPVWVLASASKASAVPRE